MKILLVKPTSHTDSITPPLGLGYLATALRPKHDVSILDAPKTGLTPKKFARILKDLNPEVVGFNVVSLDLYLTASYLRIVRDILPDAVTIVGGPHPSGEPEDTFYNYMPDLDYAFIGEAEKGLRMLVDMIEGNTLEDKDLQSVPGLVWKRGSDIYRNPTYIEQDLDSLGFVAWDLMDPRTYPPAPHAAFARKFPVATISATRGCPFECKFCAASRIQGKKIRRRSVAHVIEEVELLVRQYGIKELHIIDDNFTYNRDYTLDFCEQMSRRFPNLAWTCPNGVRLDTLDREVLSAMKKSGCYILAVGIESGNQKVLDRVLKKQTLDIVRERVKLIHESGIEVTGFLGLGWPGETVEEIMNTIDFSIELPLIRAQYMFFHPMAGTKQFRNIIRTHPEKLRAVYSCLGKIAYVEDGISSRELKRLHRTAFLRFYLRPRQLIHLLTSIRGPRHAYHIMNRIFRWMVIG